MWAAIYLSIYLSISPSIYRSNCLSIYLSICLSVYLFVYVSIYLFIDLSWYLTICLCVYVSVCLSVSLSVCLSIYLSIHPSIYLSVYLSVYLSIKLSLYLSIYLPIYLSARSKTKKFCETSLVFEHNNVQNETILRDVFIFELDNIRNEAILRDFLIFRSWRHQKRKNSARLPSKMESWVQSWQPRTNAFCDFPVHLSKVLRLPRKIDARSYEVLHLSRKIILANLHIWYSKMQPLSGNQRPDLLTSLINMSFVLRLPRKMHLCRSSSNVPCLPSFLEMLQNPHVLLTFEEVHNPLQLPRETTSEPPKVVRA